MGVTLNEGSLQLDAKSPDPQSNKTADWPPTDRLVCIPTDEATAQLLQLETKPGSGYNRYFQPRFGSGEGIYQPPVVLIAPEPDKETDGKSSDNHPLVVITIMVPNNSGNARGLSQSFTSEGGPSNTPNGSGVHNEPRSSGVSGMAYIRKSFASQRISSEALALLLA